MTVLKLRNYQQEALDAIDSDLTSGFTRVACVLPTGAGKTVLFAHLVEQAHREGKKALILVHREELAEQARTKIHSVAPHLTVGIVKAERNEVDADVIVGSIQTLANPVRREAIEGIGIVIADECHRSSARTWMETLEHFGCFGWGDGDQVTPPTPATPAVGFTATLARNDGAGLGDVWEHVAYEKDILWMIDNGYLADVRGQQVTVGGLDLATIARSRGDYQEGQLGDAMEAAGAGEVIAKAYWEHASRPDGTLRPGILFAPTVSSALSFAESMRQSRIRTETVTGTTPREDRELIYKRYQAGEIDVLSSVGVLVEGFDAPWAEVCVMARPTQSPVLFAQAIGRVLRPWPGKDEALVLDVVGIAGRHKLQSLTDLVKTSVQDGESYAEARVRLEREAKIRADAPDRIAGAIAARHVELFANSHSAWLQTKGGRWFIPTTYGYFFLWPSLTEEGDLGGTWRVGYVLNKKGGPRQPGWIENCRNLTLEYAMAWGEQLAEEDDPTVSLRDRAWRRTKPSEGQFKMALRLKVAPIDELMTLRKGAVSDLISVALASRQIDV